MLAKLLKDFKDIARVAGIDIALRWPACVVALRPSALKGRNLLAADCMTVTDAFRVHHAIGIAAQTGNSASSGLRKIWLGGAYTGGFPRVPKLPTIVYLGASIGDFSAQGARGKSTCAIDRNRPHAWLGATEWQRWRPTASRTARNFTERSSLSLPMDSAAISKLSCL